VTPGPLGRRFYARSTLRLARALLGAWLCRRQGDVILRGRIVEVEAYTDDAASHARGRRRTPRNAVMFGPPGVAYVYFTYGMHHCVNVVAERDGVPGAVLLRGLDGLAGANGPGRLCRALGIDRRFDGVDLTAGDRPWRFYLAGSPGVSRRDRAAEAAG
jgi:DNA-3-methyladenine glycosylase